MLTPDYFDGGKERELRQLLKNFSMKDSLVISKDVKADIIRDRLIVDVSVYDVLVMREPEFVNYLLPWTRDSRIIRRGSIVAIEFPLINGFVTEITRTYELDARVMGTFWYCGLYTVQAEFDKFDKMRSVGWFDFSFELPGSRESVKDGQLKIVTDAVVAVDMLPSRDNVKILVVGSSSHGISGLAYIAIGKMLSNSHVFLYDPVGVTVDFEIETNVFHYRSEFYDYADAHLYDLVLDDTWVESSERSDRDPFGRVYESKAFSIKCFPFEKVSGRRYYQLFRTKGREFRIVDKPRIYNYAFQPLGHCPSCIELKYLLKNTYRDDFYAFFLSSHRVNCLTGQYRDLSEETEISYNYKEIEKPSEDFLDTCYKLPWDTGFECKDIPVNSHMLSGADIIVSDDRFITGFVVNHSRCIIKIDKIDDNNGDYIERFYYLGEKMVYDFVIVQNHVPPVFPVVDVDRYNVHQRRQGRVMNQSGKTSKKGKFRGNVAFSKRDRDKKRH